MQLLFLLNKEHQSFSDYPLFPVAENQTSSTTTESTETLKSTTQTLVTTRSSSTSTKTASPTTEKAITSSPTPAVSVDISTTTGRSTTTTTTTPTKLSSYQIALNLASRVSEDLKNSDTEIIDLLKTYNETMDLPQWQQRAVAEKLSTMLQEGENSEEIIPTSNIDSPVSSASTPSILTSTTSSLMETVNKLVKELKMPYLDQKKEDPSLTPKEFIDTFEDTSGLSIAARTVLAKALQQELGNGK